jgi:predicted CXXCH cytochrome family protein
MKMNKLNSALSRMGGGVATALFVAGALGSAPALAAALTGIASTKHNLSSGATSANNKSSGASATAEICVFCHTPHGSDISAVVPLWNKKMAKADTYTTYNSLGTSSLDGNTAPVGSVSLACLSCHDGSQAMNVMINQPGSGNYFSGGQALGEMTGPGGALDGGKMPAGIANLSKDLRNDHPIGIQYGGGPGSAGIGSGATYTNFRDADFKTANMAEVNGRNVWWVDTEASPNSTRQKTDMQLYSRAGLTFVNSGGGSLGATDFQPFVECASCHDPHSTNTTFLRIENTASAVCLACHDK